MTVKAMDIILLGCKTHITQDLVLLQTLAQSPMTSDKQSQCPSLCW